MAEQAAKKLQKSYFDVLGLCCSSEVPLVENILKPLLGVKEVSVVVATRTVIVVHDSLLISQLQIGKYTLNCHYNFFSSISLGILEMIPDEASLSQIGYR